MLQTHIFSCLTPEISLDISSVVVTGGIRYEDISIIIILEAIPIQVAVYFITGAPDIRPRYALWARA